MKACTVAFRKPHGEWSSLYTYKYPDEMVIKSGDLVVVPGSATEPWPKVAKVIGLLEEYIENPKWRTKYVLAVIDDYMLLLEETEQEAFDND